MDIYQNVCHCCIRVVVEMKPLFILGVFFCAAMYVHPRPKKSSRPKQSVLNPTPCHQKNRQKSEIRNSCSKPQIRQRVSLFRSSLQTIAQTIATPRLKPAECITHWPALYIYVLSTMSSAIATQMYFLPAAAYVCTCRFPAAAAQHVSTETAGLPTRRTAASARSKSHRSLPPSLATLFRSFIYVWGNVSRSS